MRAIYKEFRAEWKKCAKEAAPPSFREFQDHWAQRWRAHAQWLAEQGRCTGLKATLADAKTTQVDLFDGGPHANT
jgi:hypothetical protein